jgi:phosphoglycerate dehydrogenase-like enzyme
MNVIAVGTGTRSTEAAEIGADEYVVRDGLLDAVAKADTIVLCCPHTPETTNLVSAKVIAAFKPGLTLVNIARGVVIDEDAMIAALQSGQIGFAALDVFREEPLPSESPLWDLPNVLVSPHSASTAYSENDRLVEIFLRNLTHFLDGDIEQMSPRLDPHRGY